MNELTAEVRPIVDEKHDFARARGGVRRGETGWARADDEQVAARIELRIVGWRGIVRIEAAEAGKSADRRLERLPPRPEKVL